MLSCDFELNKTKEAIWIDAGKLETWSLFHTKLNGYGAAISFFETDSIYHKWWAKFVL